MFTTSIGTPLEARNVVRSFKAILARAGLPDVRFHDLRHSCATLLLVQGVSPRVVMEILGHSQISLTMCPQCARRCQRSRIFASPYSCGGRAVDPQRLSLRPRRNRPSGGGCPVLLLALRSLPYTEDMVEKVREP